MNEVKALIDAFDEAGARGERCALATVVSVRGSSYRRPGARMLICEGGASTGTISAGCLEGDVVEHAKRVIESGVPKVVVYDTASTSDEIAWGLGLGCDGIVRVLVEPVAPRSPYAAALRRSSSLDPDSAPIPVATVIDHSPSPGSLAKAAEVVVGSRLFFEERGGVCHEGWSGELATSVEGDLRECSSEEAAGVRVYEQHGAKTEVFIEMLSAPVSLVVFGAGQDAVPVVELARSLGWHTEVVDPQARLASRSRFSQADRVTLARPESVGEHVKITPRTMTLLMSHNYSDDVKLLAFLLASPARYIGVMGPRKRTDRMLTELAAEDTARLHAPVGLDVGANSPVEIALSIIAEVRAVLAGRHGGMLRERQGPIYGGTRDSGEGDPVAGVGTDGKFSAP